MQGRFKMEYRLFTVVRYNYKDYNTPSKPNINIRGSSRKIVGNFNTMNIKFGLVWNGNLGGVRVVLQFLKRWAKTVH